MVWKQRPLEPLPPRQLWLRLIAVSVAFAALLAGAAVGGVGYFRASEPDGAIERLANRYAYDFTGWELRNFPNMLLYKTGHAFSTPGRESDQMAIEEYFKATGDILRLQSGEGDPAQLEAALAQREKLENRVESILENSIVGLLRSEGLAVSPPLFGGIDMIFPPVDFELDEPPKILAISPRDRIALRDSFDLRAGLSGETVASIERDAEATGVSAVVLDLGGIATYPAIVPATNSYPRLVHTAIHEWTHHYLALFPLGQSYFASSEVRTMNETVADMVADELAPKILRVHPLPTDNRPVSFPNPNFDFGERMRQLRLDVDELLKQGRVAEAEALMELTRRLLAANGIFIRKLNQAYLAFNNFYAAQPGSIDPIGPKMRELRGRSDALADFMKTVSRLSSSRDLDAALAG